MHNSRSWLSSDGQLRVQNPLVLACHHHHLWNGQTTIGHILDFLNLRITYEFIIESQKSDISSSKDSEVLNNQPRTV